MHHPSRTGMAHMRYTSELCRFRIVPVLDILRVTVRSCYLWWRDVRPGQNFDSVTLMFSATPFLGVQLESSEVMLPKFHSDSVAHHK
jgi:hypothetical protein